MYCWYSRVASRVKLWKPYCGESVKKINYANSGVLSKKQWLPMAVRILWRIYMVPFCHYFWMIFGSFWHRKRRVSECSQDRPLRCGFVACWVVIVSYAIHHAALTRQMIIFIRTSLNQKSSATLFRLLSSRLEFIYALRVYLNCNCLAAI